MIIRNTTKNRIIGHNARLCDDYLSKFIGLMFTKQRRILIFAFNKEKIIYLHMLFVFYPIDVLFLGKNKIIVDKKENFKPFTFCNSKKKAMYAVEIPENTIKKTNTKIGDKIRF